MAGNKSTFRLKVLPQRSCFSCHTVRSKPELVRIVRTPQGGVEVDEGGKRPGRGAYLCKSWECWEKGLKRGHLAHSLKIQIAPEDVNKLWKHAEALNAGLSTTSHG